MIIETIGCPVCSASKLDEGAEPDEIARVGHAAMRGARITTEIAQLHHCAEGHEFLLQLQDGGYALLYERALQRLAQGRTRDAVLDAYTAFDMFLVSFVLGVAFDKRYPRPTPLDQAPLEPLRKDLEPAIRTAERTTGAALALAAAASGRAPPKIPRELNELRNKAVHAGAYPSDEEAERACVQVAELVCDFRDHVPIARVDAEPFDRFHFALLQESRRRAVGSRPWPRTVTHALLTVLDAGNPPVRGAAARRVEDFRLRGLPYSIE